MIEFSPAVERASVAARHWAVQTGMPGDVRIGHWLLALTDDEEGRPAAALARMPVDLAEARSAFGFAVAESPSVPEPHQIFVAARTLSLQLRADPEPTSDVVFLALLNADPHTAQQAGVDPARFADCIRGQEIATETTAVADFVFEFQPPAETLLAARAVDANLNRAREALRVVEDFSRFVLDDAGFSRDLKRLRHRLTAATDRLDARRLITARDTPNDVGTHISTAAEYSRPTPASVATANFKRLQESLRSLEEFGKVLDGEFARAVEAIRYESYTLEAAVSRRIGQPVKLSDARLYLLLTGATCTASLDWTVAEAAAGGVDIVQLREKALSDRELLERAKKMRVWTRQAGVLFIVNDRPDIARLCEADGVHLGQDDLTVAAARRIMGAEALIGVSTHNEEQLRQAVRDGADYVGIGPVFPSKTKEFAQFPGLEFVRDAHVETKLPCFALGGIDLANLPLVLEAGAKRIAVSSAIASSDEPAAIARLFRSKLA